MGITEQPGECGDAAAFYRRKFDWPCTASGHAVWMLAGEVLDAVDVPEFFGPGMVELLHGADRPAMVIEVPGDPERWRFLVRPGGDGSHLVARALAGHGAVYLERAEVIELPPTRVRGGQLCWLLGPDDTAPSLGQVAAALAAVVMAESRSEQGHSRR